MVAARSTLTGGGVKSPSVQGAHQIITVDLSEHREIGAPMWTLPLNDERSDLDLIVNVIVVASALGHRLGFGAAHALDGE